MSRSLLPMLLFHEVCHSSKIYLLKDGLKLENGILKEVGLPFFQDIFIERWLKIGKWNFKRSWFYRAA